MKYKQFNVDNSKYIYCVEDLEIIKIHQDENIVNILHEISNKKKNQTRINKVQTLKLDFPKNVLINTIGVDLTNGCNLNCTYCFLSASSKKRKLLSKNKFIDILNFLKNEKGHPITFYFAGTGEPTFNFNLIKQLPMLCKENGFKNCFFDLTTNGTLFTPEMIDFFKHNKFEISISMDGNEEIHNLSRVYPNGKGSFNDVFNNIKLLKKIILIFLVKLQFYQAIKI